MFSTKKVTHLSKFFDSNIAIGFAMKSQLAPYCLSTAKQIALLLTYGVYIMQPLSHTWREV